MHKPQLTGISADEYLATEMQSPERHEYVAGEVYTMAGVTQRHNLITGNLTAFLHRNLRGRRCRVFFSEMKLRVETVDAFYYPDVLVSCEPTDIQEYYLERPCLVIEVLSPSTAGTDRREKLHAYRTLPSLREYVLVDQDRRAVWAYRRAGGDGWLLAKRGPGDTLYLESVALSIPLDEVYDNVELPREEDLREEEALYMLTG